MWTNEGELHCSARTRTPGRIGQSTQARASAGGHRIRRLKRMAWALAALLTLTVGVIGLRSWLRPTIQTNRIRTARVEEGVVEAATLCAGAVVPETEHLIACPLSSRIQAEKPTRLVIVLEP